jgi:hypothetical protein
MKNPFKNILFKKKKMAEKAAEQKLINEPWKKKTDERPETAANRTVIGRRPDNFPGKKDDRSSFGSGYQCPECSYPLSMQVSAKTPCPNCGHAGEPQAAAPQAKTTIAFGQLNFGQLAGERKFTLVNESAPDMSLSAELDEAAEIVLGREELEPNNPSISGEGHIQLREQKGRWFVKDVSSNGATFIQANGLLPLFEGTRIILGNRIFKVSTGAPNAAPPAGNKTMQFGQFNLQGGQENAITLVDEVNGLAKKCTGERIELNRFNVDPDEQSISSKLHASLENRQGNWLLTDQSSNKATFVQVLDEMHIQHQTRLIVGNKVFRFELG